MKSRCEHACLERLIDPKTTVLGRTFDMENHDVRFPSNPAQKEKD